MDEQKHPARHPQSATRKGGVGNTKTTVNLAAALGTLGLRSLVIDLDANCARHRCLGVPPASYQGAYEVLIGVEDPLAVALATDPDEGVELPQGVELIPASRDLERVDIDLAAKHRFTGQAGGWPSGNRWRPSKRRGGTTMCSSIRLPILRHRPSRHIARPSGFC